MDIVDLFLTKTLRCHGFWNSDLVWDGGCFVLPLGSYMRPQVTIDNKYVLMNRVLYDDDSVYAAILRTSVSGFDWKKNVPRELVTEMFGICR
jgi:hypothetical protein